MSSTSDGEEVRIGVADRGFGIAASEIERIFEPFYRGKEALEAQIRGNGLGLSLVRQIVEAHGGRISLESKVGQGSRFTLQLPVPPAAENSTTNI
jgi:signal transduction histidine kinase